MVYTKQSLPPTLSDAAVDFLNSYRNLNTKKTYKFAIVQFFGFLESINVPTTTPPQEISEDLIRGFIAYLDNLEPNEGNKPTSETSKELYVTGIRSFLNHLVYLGVGDNINSARLTQIIKKEGPKRPKRDQIHVDIHAIHLIIEYASSLHLRSVEGERFPELKKLQNYRDRALIFSLVSTGARIGEEMLPLDRGSIHWETKTAHVIGKGNKAGELLFSKDAIGAIQDYLQIRSSIDGASGQPLANLPLFSRHDIKVKNKALRLGYSSAYRSLKSIAEIALQDYGQIKFNPHMFRHFFVTNIIQSTNGDIDMARALARHSSTTITSRYMHTAKGDKREIHDKAFS